MGKESQREGKAFEEFFELVCNRSGISWLKLHVGARIYGSNDSGQAKWTLAPCPFDYVLGAKIGPYSRSAYIDCKSINSASFPSSLVDWAQIINLLNFESCGHPAGYVIHFRKIHKIVFIKSSFIQAIGNSRSFSPVDGLDLGDLFSMDIKKIWV